MNMVSMVLILTPHNFVGVNVDYACPLFVKTNVVQLGILFYLSVKVFYLCNHQF